MTDIQALPDYATLRQVQDALWKIGEVHGAAVMVGAGFSRFADRASATTLVPPLWSDFRDEMLAALYPSGGGPTDPLVLAEEYRAALGEPALENLIRGRVRDAEWTPGPLHSRLLKLPWADVLTTNWDTLLERAATADPDTSYDVVRAVSDIARARQPRIVKLHGSLPSNSPFIFSEEDFRTYPQRFAPFVNLAQQALLENELCLLGFSGDDPNFLEWAGWVRDKLGTAARPIRLVGVLNLSQSRRRLLERRNITPIDLAPLVREVAFADRHRCATEMFLESLWHARPKTRAEWNRLPEKDYGIEHLPDPEAKLIRLAQIWADDRSRHPGWLVTPYFVRQRGRFDINDSIKLLAGNLDKVSAPARLNILFEATWLWDTLFWALPDFVEKAIDDATAGGEDKRLSVTQQMLLRATIVRAARRRRDWGAFDKRIARLETLGTPEAKTEAIYERCLRARDEIDHQYITANSAEVAGNDPVWLLRRAALLAEVMDARRAARTIQEAYEEIRRRRAQDRRGLWLLSREAWASWLLQSARFELDDLHRHDDRPDWPLAYKAAETDPWDEIQRIDADLNKADSETRNAAREREPLFDAGFYRLRGTGTRWVSSAASSPYEALVGLADNVGVPLQLGSVSLIDSRLARAIDVALEDDAAGAWVALRSVVNHNRGLIDTRFSRVAIARLPLETVEGMSASLRGAIEFGRSRIAALGDGGQIAHWSNRIRTLTELLSRLSLRFDGDIALDLFRFGAVLLRDPALTHWWMLEGIGNLLRRSLQALEPARRGEAALEVLLLPLPLDKGFAGNERDFPEMSDCLNKQGWSTRQDIHAWSARIAFLINVVSENAHHQSRGHAVFRLLRLFEAGALTEEESKAFGEALWRHVDPDGLPADTYLLPHAFLGLPCPDDDRPRRGFEAAVVKKLAAGMLGPEFATSLLSASYTLEGKYQRYPLDAGDALAILDHALAWTPRASPPHSIFRHDSENDRLADAIGGMLASTVLPALDAAAIGAGRCEAIFERITDRTLPQLLKALPALVRADKDQAEKANKAIRNGLLSQDSRIVVPALTAIYWLAQSAIDGGEAVPPALAAEVVSLCLMRREPGLISALRTVRTLLKANALATEDRQRLLEALELIQAETTYGDWSDKERWSDVGLIRGAALKLAADLKQAGTTTPSIDDWIANAGADPMPEVRYALVTGSEED